MDNTALFLYDSECLMCNRFIQYLITNDHSNVLFFGSLLSKEAKTLLEKRGVEFNLDNPQTAILIIDDKIYLKTDAIIQAFIQIKRWTLVMRLFTLLPKAIRDIGYDFIAKHRKIVVKNDVCLIDLKVKSRIVF